MNQIVRNTTFASFAGFNSAIAQVVRDMGIAPTLKNTTRADVRFEMWLERDAELVVADSLLRFHIRRVNWAIKWGWQTGRFCHQAEAYIKSLTPYEKAKLIVKLAFTTSTDQEVVDYLLGKMGIDLPISKF
jgi:hypothetical protein